MTPDEVVFQALLTSGLKGTKVGWPIGGAPPLPWFTYKHKRGGEFFADDGNFAKMRRYTVDLYEKVPDEEVGERFEEALSIIGPYSENESFITTENAWVTSYTVTYHP